MDFALTEDHAEVRDLAAQILGDLAQVERVVDVERNHGGFDARLWETLASSGLIGIAVPEDKGGAGLGVGGLVALLEQQGRHVAPVPLWSVVAGAALPLAEFGSAAQVERWLGPVVEGTLIVTGAFDAAPGQVARLTGLRVDGGLRVTGELPQVPAAPVAAAVVVPVALEDGGLRVAVVPVDRRGVTVVPVAATSNESAGAVAFEDVVLTEDDLLPADGARVVAWTRRRLRIALAAVALGVCEEDLRITAAYTSERVQFGRPLSTNQAVAVRATDAYLDTEAIRLTTQKAAWLLDNGDEEAAESASLVAKWWASVGGLRVVHAGQHLHGGIGADIDYPVHRYFLWGRQVAFSLGSGDAVAAELGDALPTAPRIGAPA
ncbi:acyl-CoA dehydrogenase family protein [Nocardioides sp. SLBN-35]|uniref:acyl-CoA dehydrogenase family protein n=1 Tax=Nocardioides sp. SLBN-35 TaxID=2768445 RepID=UPI0011538B9F|nr:acyl-CoA dehydrogenase family protein [Nocardioides sp. SLBN-35]TQK71976.1 alkylation response protein AidB-like acyl-CoA dehydrogenase [Nocardioides sp. SLBN-35]